MAQIFYNYLKPVNSKKWLLLKIRDVIKKADFDGVFMCKKVFFL